MARSRVTQRTASVANPTDVVVSPAGRSRSVQPVFVSTLSRSSGGSNVSPSVQDTSRSGDIRVEDLDPGSILTRHLQDVSITTAKIADLSVTEAKIDNLAVTDAKIGSLSADKITAGTLDVGIVTITSDDGKMTLADNIFQIKNGSDAIQITLGEYDGTNFGLAMGNNPAAPTAIMNSVGLTVQSTGSIKLNGANIRLQTNDGIGLIGRVASLQSGGNSDFFLEGGDGTVHILGNLGLGETSSTYPVHPLNFGSGIGVVYIKNAQTAPSANPAIGGLLYSQAGALKWRGSSGTITTIAAA